MTPDEFAHILPAEHFPDAMILRRTAGDIRRLVARVRALEADLSLVRDTADRWVERLADRAEEAEKQRDELAYVMRGIANGLYGSRADTVASADCNQIARGLTCEAF